MLAARDAAHKPMAAVFFLAVGGAGVLLSKRIRRAEVVVYEDIRVEAIRRMDVQDFPVIVCNDIHGSDALEQGRRQWRRAEAFGKM